MNYNQVWEEAKKVWDNESAVVAHLKEMIDPGAFAKCVDLISTCTGRIVVAGVGTSAAAAKKIAHSLCCIEQPAFFLSPGDAVHGGLGAVRENDVAIVISKGGNTREIVNILPAIKTKKAFLIAVTENENSILAEQSDLLMRVRVERESDPFNMLATASTLAAIAVFDAICVVLMEKTGYTKEQFEIIHPGGAVGERLLKKKH
jgi:KpsF/GutQ family protein